MIVKKARNLLTAEEVTTLYKELDVKLGQIGIETQPAVATKILDLTKDPDAGMADYAKIICNDAALSGRLLRLANSAFFAQRKPVTNIDRACVLLGTGRLKSIALGFYLSRAAASDAAARISREIWGQSVYRACLATELAKKLCPEQAPEAFVIGLMLDAAIPLAHKLLGKPFEYLYDEDLTPIKSFNTEFERHPFTHIDLISVLMRRWKFPELLTKPIEWHHTPPPPIGRHDPLGKLHRLAYYVGAVKLTPDGKPDRPLPMQETARSQLELATGDLRSIITKSNAEYDLVIDLFSGVADGIGDPDKLAEQVHMQLISVLDEDIASEIADTTKPGPQYFTLGGLTVMLRPEDDGVGTAFAYDSAGEPLSTYRFIFATETASSICDALGLEKEPGDDIETMTEYIDKLAA